MKKMILNSLLILSMTSPVIAEERKDSGEQKHHIGVLLFESSGAAASMGPNGHLAVVLTNVCTSDYLTLRKCSPDESPGVVINRYLGILKHPAAEYQFQVLPLQDAFTISKDYGLTPIIVTGKISEKMTVKYWLDSKEFQKAYPSLTNEELETLIKTDKENQYSAGRAKGPGALFMGLDFIFQATHLKQMTEESWRKRNVFYENAEKDIRIPQGRWRASLGIRHNRDSMLAYSEVSQAGVDKVINYVNGLNNAKDVFSAMTNNCSDFVKDVLKQAYPNLKFKSRFLKPADAFLTSPLAVTTDYLNFVRKNNIPYAVQHIPQMAGSRMTSVQAKTIVEAYALPTRGAHWIPNVVRAYLTFGNPLFKGALEAAKLVQGNVNVNKVVNRDSDALGNIEDEAVAQLSAELGKEFEAEKEKNGKLIKDTVKSILSQRQAEVFGIPQCWKAKETQFFNMVRGLEEAQLIEKNEAQLLTKKAEGRNYTQLLDEQGLTLRFEGAGGKDLVYQIGRGETSKFSGATRSNILDYKNPEYKGLPLDKSLALKVMLASINYDLHSAPENRRLTQEFDADWSTFEQILNDVQPTSTGRSSIEKSISESVYDCSKREYEEALAEGKTIKNYKDADMNPIKSTLKKMTNGFVAPITSILQLFKPKYKKGPKDEDTF